MLARKMAAVVVSLVISFGGIGVAEITSPAIASAQLTAGTTANYPVLKNGSRGTAVRVLQYALLHNGISVSVDGIFGNGTQSAVVRFQNNKGLYPDGVVGEKTWAALLSQVQNGSRGNLVKAVQMRVGTTVDGIFGSGTERAVIAFQKANGLQGDGVVGPATWGKILGASTSTPPSTGLNNPYPAAKSCNGCWTQRAAWVRDKIKSQFGLTCTTYASSSLTSDHRNGNGMDCWGTRTQMYNLSRWAAANAGPLKVQYVIFEQRIWNISRASEGWRWMADRGSRTANHYDHVHISIQN